jgi:hypothetical protein
MVLPHMFFNDDWPCFHIEWIVASSLKFESKLAVLRIMSLVNEIDTVWNEVEPSERTVESSWINRCVDNQNGSSMMLAR